MDLNDFWQENKKLLIAIGCGLLVFLIGNLFIESSYGDDLRSTRRARDAERQKLTKERYSTSDREVAHDENEALVAALRDLAAGVAFRPRPAFVVDPTLGSPGAQYFTRLEEVRESLSLAAGRARLVPPDDSWGIEALATNELPVLERHLEALDVIDRVVRLAIDAGVQRIDRIQVTLDPGFGGREGLGHVERTAVSFALTTSSVSLTRLLRMSQNEAAAGQPLALGEFTVKGLPSRPEQVKADLVFHVVRLHDLPGDDDDEEID